MCALYHLSATACERLETCPPPPPPTPAWLPAGYLPSTSTMTTLLRMVLSPPPPSSSSTAAASGPQQQQQRQRCTSIDLASLVYTCAALRFQPQPQQVQQILDQAYQLLDHRGSTPPVLLLLLASLSKLGVRPPPPWLHAWCLVLRTDWPLISCEGLASTAYTLAWMDHLPATSFLQELTLECRGRWGSFGPEPLWKLLSGLARLQQVERKMAHRPSPSPAHSTPLYAALMATPQPLVLWRLQRRWWRSTQLRLTTSALPHDFLPAAAAQAQALLPWFTATGLTHLLWALAALCNDRQQQQQLQPLMTPCWLESCTARLLLLMSSVPTAALSRAVWGLRRLGTSSSSPQGDALLHACLRRCSVEADEVAKGRLERELRRWRRWLGPRACLRRKRYFAGQAALRARQRRLQSGQLSAPWQGELGQERALANSMNAQRRSELKRFFNMQARRLRLKAAAARL